ncbi:MAG: hypothetical protein O7D36_12585 [Gammaproteobacteria bacterium]|nr:hypothetical protein [Gammaproteobacteria bacterium]
MNPPTKTTAQKRADQIHAFQHELAELTREQILNLSADQQAAIPALNIHYVGLNPV